MRRPAVPAARIVKRCPGKFTPDALPVVVAVEVVVVAGALGPAAAHDVRRRDDGAKQTGAPQVEVGVIPASIAQNSVVMNDGFVSRNSL
jgi:hypothetical protein